MNQFNYWQRGDASPKPKGPNYQAMGFAEMEMDPVAEPILQQMALQYLRTKNKVYFESNFNGDLDEQGNLLDKDGFSDTKPSQNIEMGEAMDEVVKMTRAELLKLGH